MAEYPHRLLVVTAVLSQVKSPYAHSAVNPNQITQSLIAVLAGLRVPFVCTETHEMGEEILASYLYQVHLYRVAGRERIWSCSDRQRSMISVSIECPRYRFLPDAVSAHHSGYCDLGIGLLGRGQPLKARSSRVAKKCSAFHKNPPIQSPTSKIAFIYLLTNCG